MTEQEMQEISNFVLEYITENPHASSREISKAIYNQLGISVSHITIQQILHALGYRARRWAREATQ